MSEFRKLFDLPPVRLLKADVELLAKITTDGLNMKPDQNIFSISAGDVRHSAKSVDELDTLELPTLIDSMSITVHGWTEDNRIDRGISLNLHRTLANCQIHAEDEVWFQGKMKQIETFFRERRRWYGIGDKFLPGLFGSMYPIAIFSGIFFIIMEKYQFVAFSALMFVASSYGFNKLINGTLFPHTDLQLTKTNSPISRENLVFFMIAISTTATVVGAIYQIWPNALK